MRPFYDKILGLQEATLFATQQLPDIVISIIVIKNNNIVNVEMAQLKRENRYILIASLQTEKGVCALQGKI